VQQAASHLRCRAPSARACFTLSSTPSKRPSPLKLWRAVRVRRGAGRGRVSRCSWQGLARGDELGCPHHPRRPPRQPHTAHTTTMRPATRAWQCCRNFYCRAAPSGSLEYWSYFPAVPRTDCPQSCCSLAERRPCGLVTRKRAPPTARATGENVGSKEGVTGGPPLSTAVPAAPGLQEFLAVTTSHFYYGLFERDLGLSG
jgi:hypothetical protein